MANVIVGFLNIIPFKWLSNIYGPILLSAKIGMQIYYYISLLIFHLVITFPVVVGYVPCCGWLFIRIGKRMEIKATYYYYVGTPTPLNWSQRLLLYYKIITILLMLSTFGWQESIILRYKFNDLCCLQPRPHHNIQVTCCCYCCLLLNHWGCAIIIITMHAPLNSFRGWVVVEVVTGNIIYRRNFNNNNNNNVLHSSWVRKLEI